jgi:hypothetical protein
VVTPEKETQADQPEASGDYDMLPDEEPPKYEGKKARKCQLDEAEEVMVWETAANHNKKEVWGTA